MAALCLAPRLQQAVYYRNHWENTTGSSRFAIGNSNETTLAV